MTAEPTVSALVLAETPVDGRLAYDVGRLADHGFTLDIPRRHALRAARKIRDVVEHRSGMKWEEAVRGIGARADMTLALLEQFALAPLQLKKLRIPPYHAHPVVMLSCWLSEELRRMSPSERRSVARRFAGVDLILFLSENQREIFVDAGFTEGQLAAVPFGIEWNRFPTPPSSRERDIPILSVGFDRGRDYRTLFRAVEGMRTRVDLYCKPVNLAGLQAPSNVTVHAPVPYEEYVSLLNRAQVVAVPTFDLAYPTGQSVALEASAAGCCVVATRSQALSEYLHDGSTALLSEPGQADQLRFRLEEAVQNEQLRTRLGAAAREMVGARYTTRHMWSAVATIVRERVCFR
ncbi:glycosyltransferase family 4 protein [Humibacter ginsenosidimutans]|uniref:D-inositol 3-phosphate glycosyltransferase n=1 Tax=Humibacter ginsenosidimutans TaxID=2599293 RepID=A0A5B8M3P8_9MICO|nr:glycosyltransferase family 4 protein [Humibacter ginsenosidimutans]QDZ14983.1 glycosyltransferase family 4 protein [Humibacter ginsenosidimutans]